LKRFIKKYLFLPQPQLTSTIFIPLFVVLSFIAVVNSVQASIIYEDINNVNYFFKFLVSKTIFCWYYLLLAFVIQALSIRMHLTRTNALRWTSTHFAILLLFLFLHQLLTYAVDSMIWEGILQISYRDLLLKTITTWLDIGVYIFFLLCFFMIEYQRLSQENAIKFSQLEVMLVKSQLQELRSLIHPQFLFNTLQSISDLLDTDQNKKANQILTSLSNFLRKTVYDTERDETTLGEEIDFLRQYLEIERIRFPQEFKIQETVEPEIAHALVPTYLLQPIVEKYTVAALEQGIGSYTLIMDIKRKNGDVLVHLEDAGAGIGGRQFSDEGVLNITRERLGHFFKSEHSLHMATKPDGGMNLEIQFPYCDKRNDPRLMDGKETL